MISCCNPCTIELNFGFCFLFSFLNAPILIAPEVVVVHQKAPKKLKRPYLERLQKIAQGDIHIYIRISNLWHTFKWANVRSVICTCNNHIFFFLHNSDDFPKVMTIQGILRHFLQRHVVRLHHHLEQFHHVHLFNMMLYPVAVKSALLSHHIDNQKEGDLIQNNRL